MRESRRISIRQYRAQKGCVKARGLYGNGSDFQQLVLLYLARNVPHDIDDSSGGSARRTRILDLPDCVVASPEAADGKQRYSTLESRFPTWRPSLLFCLQMVYPRLMVGHGHGNITPVPADVTNAVDGELA